MGAYNLRTVTHAYSLDVRFAYIPLFIAPLSSPPVMQVAVGVEAFEVDDELYAFAG